MSQIERYFGEELLEPRGRGESGGASTPFEASANGSRLAAAPGGPGDAPDPLVANVPTLEELERVHIRFVLERVRWHQGRAAVVLGISSKTLYRKIRQYGFHRPPTPFAKK